MKCHPSPLYSEYIIDGVLMDNTPAEMMDSCIPSRSGRERKDEREYDTVVDESIDPNPAGTKYDVSLAAEYLDRIHKFGNAGIPEVQIFPRSKARRETAGSLLDFIWRKGHFTIEDLDATAVWKWNTAPLGSMAAFYRSAESLSEYIFDLGIRLEKYEFHQDDRLSELTLSISTDYTEAESAVPDDEYDFLDETPAREFRPCWSSPEERKCGKNLVPDKNSWLIYVPFDTCDFRLGDSALERIAGPSGETAPEIQDPDYFIDCFEVIRELVEDGIVISGNTVGSGGLALAAEAMCGEAGICIDISGIGSAYGETDYVRILFGETPGVLIQIRDSDYDYFDSQMLLQDIAYYPVGHPDPESGGFSVSESRRPGVPDILASLIREQYSEGED